MAPITRSKTRSNRLAFQDEHIGENDHDFRLVYKNKLVYEVHAQSLPTSTENGIFIRPLRAMIVDAVTGKLRLRRLLDDFPDKAWTEARARWARMCERPKHERCCYLPYYDWEDGDSDLELDEFQAKLKNRKVERRLEREKIGL